MEMYGKELSNNQLNELQPTSKKSQEKPKKLNEDRLNLGDWVNSPLMMTQPLDIKLLNLD